MRSSIASWSAAACSRLMGRHTEPNTSGLTIPPRNPHLPRWPEFPENARQNFRNPHLFAAVFVAVLLAMWPTVPWDGIQLGAPLGMAITPFILYPVSKLAWLAFDLAFRPERGR